MTDQTGVASMSQPNANAPTRKRVSQACIPCGDKKVKCDGIQPVCGPCVTKHVSCQYGISRRNRSGNPPYETSDGPSNAVFQQLSPRNHRNHLHSHNERARRPLASTNGMPPTISAQLFQTYFEKIHPIWPILYKPLFSNLDFGNPSTIPISLVYAIYTISASIDTPPNSDLTSANTDRNKTESLDHRLLFDETMNMLQLEGESGVGSYASAAIPASLPSCQVLTILALQQHAIAEYSRSAMLLGIAATMALNLNLNRPIAAGYPADREVRARLWWCLYVFDKILALKLAKPVILREDDTDTQFPSLSESDEFELMSSFPSNQHGSTQLQMPVKKHPVSGLHASIRLARIAEKIFSHIYSISARKRLQQGQNTTDPWPSVIQSDLENWELEINNTALKLDLGNLDGSVPSAISGYIMLWTLTILCHRPFITMHKTQSQQKSGPAESYKPEALCFQAAYNICHTLEKHFDHVPGPPGDMIFSIFISATIFLHQIKAKNTEVDELKRILKLCVHWLTNLGRNLQNSDPQATQATQSQTPSTHALGQQTQHRLHQQDSHLSFSPHDHFTNTSAPSMELGISMNNTTNNIPGQSQPSTANEFAIPITPQGAANLHHHSNGFIPTTPSSRITNPSLGVNSNLELSGDTSKGQPLTAEWAFLKDFGDGNDEDGFWALDRDLIDLLEGKGDHDSLFD